MRTKAGGPHSRKQQRNRVRVLEVATSWKLPVRTFPKASHTLHIQNQRCLGDGDEPFGALRGQGVSRGAVCGIFTPEKPVGLRPLSFRKSKNSVNI